MPTYEYECEECGHKFEKFQQMSDEPIKVCPQCKGEVKKLFSTGSGVIFKGSGFHATDYAKKSSQPAGACCGVNSPCDNPKRCCDKQ